MGSIDKALPHAGFYPDSQNFHSDAAKIDIIIETSKFWSSEIKKNAFFYDESRQNSAIS